jgi:hypothetical protein
MARLFNIFPDRHGVSALWGAGSGWPGTVQL